MKDKLRDLKQEVNQMHQREGLMRIQLENYKYK